MKVSRPKNLQENFKQINPPNYQNYKQNNNNNTAFPPISKENKAVKKSTQQEFKQNDEISHDNLLNFLNKKYTQLSPIEEVVKEKEVKKDNTSKQIPTEQKLKSQSRKMKSASSQNNINESPLAKNDVGIGMVGLDARDYLWDSNYKIKLMINQYKDDNSKLKAKIGNFERENQMLQKQFDAWKLSTHLFYDAENKPYIDNETAKGILEDSNFYAVSLKKEVKVLKERLKLYEEEIKEHNKIIEAVPEFMTNKQDEATEMLQKLLYEKEKLRLYFLNDDINSWEKLSSEMDLLKTQIREISLKNSVASREISGVQMSISEFTNEIENLNKTLEDKEIIIENLYKQIDDLSCIKFQKFGNIIAKSQNNLPESYAEIHEKQDEIERKNQIIEQNTKNLQELTFQYQETIRKSIMVKQNLLKDIDEQTKTNQDLMNFYIGLQTQNLKDQQTKLPTDELANFNSSLKKTEVDSIKGKLKEDFIFNN